MINCSRLTKRFEGKILSNTGEINFIERIKNFEFENFNKNELNLYQKQLLEIIDLLLLYNLRQANQFIKTLLANEPNHPYRIVLSQILIYILFEESNWEELSNYSYSSWVMDPDSVFLLARTFSKLEKDSTVFTVDSDSIPMIISPSGTPIIPVKINGRKRFFWFDTGTNYSVVSSDIADECLLEPLTKEKTKVVSASNYKLDATPTIIRELEIGNLKIFNHKAIIVDSAYLKMRLFGGNRITKIDGIIGWKALQNARFTIISSRGILKIENPLAFSDKSNSKKKNFFWFGFPIVVASFSGKPLLFVLDLGLEKSSLTSEIFNKIDFPKYYQQTKIQGSIGGWRFFPTTVIPYLNIKISTTEIEFFNIHTTELKKDCFFYIDGFLGADLLKQSSVTFDIQNLRFIISKN
ncbi:MAG: aspartyl protease family protein [Candidatus Kapaibacteriales bacterium]